MSAVKKRGAPTLISTSSDSICFRRRTSTSRHLSVLLMNSLDDRMSPENTLETRSFIGCVMGPCETFNKDKLPHSYLLCVGKTCVLQMQ